MIRLLLIIPSLDESGAEKQLTLLATGLPRDQFEIRVVVLTRSGPYAEQLAAAGIPIDLLHKRFKFDPVTIWKLRSLIRSWKPDLIHTWLFAGNTYGRLVAGGSFGPPVIVSERCVDSWKARWQLWLDRKLVGRTAKLVGNSQSVIDFYRQFGYDDARLQMICNGLPLDPGPAPPHPQREELRRQWSDNHEHPFIVGFIGRLAPQKRIDDLIWAIELLKSARDNVYLVVVGAGPLEAKLRDFADYFGLQKRVTFLGHRHDARELLSCFDAFGLASDFEGQSNSLMEAMGAGLPVLATDIPPNRELVTHDETGIIFPVGDRVILARQINRLAEDPERCRRLGSAARQKMLDDFSVGEMVNKYGALYRQLVESRSNHHPSISTDPVEGA